MLVFLSRSSAPMAGVRSRDSFSTAINPKAFSIWSLEEWLQAAGCCSRQLLWDFGLLWTSVLLLYYELDKPPWDIQSLEETRPLGLSNMIHPFFFFFRNLGWGDRPFGPVYKADNQLSPIDTPGIDIDLRFYSSPVSVSYLSGTLGPAGSRNYTFSPIRVPGNQR